MKFIQTQPAKLAPYLIWTPKLSEWGHKHTEARRDKAHKEAGSVSTVHSGAAASNENEAEKDTWSPCTTRFSLPLS